MVEENKGNNTAEDPVMTSQPAAAESTTQGGESLQDLTGKIELIDDNIILNEEFKKNVAIPYFKDIYKDLAAQSDAKSKGINKVSILNVSPLKQKFDQQQWSYRGCERKSPRCKIGCGFNQLHLCNFGYYFPKLLW